MSMYHPLPSVTSRTVTQALDARAARPIGPTPDPMAYAIMPSTSTQTPPMAIRPAPDAAVLTHLARSRLQRTRVAEKVGHVIRHVVVAQARVFDGSSSEEEVLPSRFYFPSSGHSQTRDGHQLRNDLI